MLGLAIGFASLALAHFQSGLFGWNLDKPDRPLTPGKFLCYVAMFHFINIATIGLMSWLFNWKLFM